MTTLTPTTTTTTKTLQQIDAEIAQLNKERKAAEEVARAARKTARRNFPRKWQFTFEQAKNNYFDRIRPESGVVCLVLKGEVLNAKYLESLGCYDSEDLRGGQMGYLYNTLNNKFVTTQGGGNIYIPYDSFGYKGSNDEVKSEMNKVFSAIEAMITEHGYNDPLIVTDIITSNPFFSWNK